MPAQAQFYLTCSACGALAKYADGKTVYGETADCVKEEAADEGWYIDDQGEATYENSLDYCPKCIPVKHRKSVIKDGLVKKACKPLVAEQSFADNPHRTSLMEKLKSIGQEGFDAMTEDQYGDWVDNLTFDEFLALVEYCHDSDEAA